MGVTEHTTRIIVNTMMKYKHELLTLDELDPEFDLFEAVNTLIELDREGQWQEHA